MIRLPPKDIGIYPTPVVMTLYESHMTIPNKFIKKKKKTHSKHQIEYQNNSRQMMSIATLLWFFFSIF